MQIIPGCGEKRDYVVEALEDKLERIVWSSQNQKQRRLADFKTYLKFNEILNDFWQTASERQKLFYFPLYFWWNLTAILPLRPTEFLLTPHGCLEADSNILTVRRTKLKGGFEKITYCIAGDYERKQYLIHKDLAAELRSYLKATANMPQPEIGTLFFVEPHYDYLRNRQTTKAPYYSYNHLQTCLQYFYREVIDKCGIKVERICPGDTRHLAMANLIISGGSPVICKELAGHSDIDISSHYYSNISNLVECVMYERYRKSKGGSAQITGEYKYALTLPALRHRVLDGWCDALEVQTGNISECLKISDSHGHIGSCPCCPHYWPDEQGVRSNFLNERKGKQKVDADCRYLIRMIETVRKGVGYSEDIGAALLRLQRSSNHYGKCLWEKYMKADDYVWLDQKN